MAQCQGSAKVIRYPIMKIIEAIFSKHVNKYKEIVKIIPKHLSEISKSMTDESRYNGLQHNVISYKGCWLTQKKGRGRFNIKTLSYQYRNYPYKCKMVVRPSHLYNGNSYTDKTTSLYWVDPRDLFLYVTEQSLSMTGDESVYGAQPIDVQLR